MSDFPLRGELKPDRKTKKFSSARSGRGVVYLAGPIAGYPNHNRDAFAAMQEALTGEGWEVVSPHEVNHDHPGKPCTGDAITRLERNSDGSESAVYDPGHRYGCYMRADLKALVQCDAIYLMPGWEASRGATIESAVAIICGIPRVYLEGEVPVLPGMPVRKERRNTGSPWQTVLGAPGQALEVESI